MSDETYGLLLAFDSDSPEFVRGFEMGRIWSLCQSDADEINETVHASNAEMLMRIGEATGRDYSAESLDDLFLDVTFGPRGGVEDG